MNQYPPGEYISDAKKGFPPAAPGLPPRTVAIDADRWGVYRVTFTVMQNPRREMSNHWFWVMDKGERLELGPQTPRAGVGNVVVGEVHGADAGTAEQAAVSSNRPTPQPESTVKISNLIAKLEAIKAEHGDLTVAEELPLGFMAIRYLDIMAVPQYRAVLGVEDGETVVVIKGE